MTDALVIGAGIGGLTAAVALQQAGCSVHVLERAERLHPVGAGLTIQPNAVLALRELGLGRIETVGQPLHAAEIRDSRDRVLTSLGAADAAALLAEVGAPAIGIHRSTLHNLLLAAAGDVVSLGTEVVEMNGREIVTASGQRLEPPLIVGADGINSAVRAGLFGRTPPRYSGYYCWRGVTAHSPFPPDWAGEFWGRGLRFGGCGIDDGRLYWFAVASGPAGGAGDIGDRFAEFPALVRDAIAATAPTDILRTDINDRDPIPHWGQGPVTLLGDAAHAMTPNLGQGACQAIEDAVALGRAVARDGPTAQALRTYEAVRITRANAVVRRSRAVGRIGQWRHPVATTIRDTAVRWTPDSVTRRQLARAWTVPAMVDRRE